MRCYNCDLGHPLMRIAFLCSSADPGRDGVGDYTRMLASECVRKGHECCIVALHERHVAAPLEESMPVSASLNEDLSAESELSTPNSRTSTLSVSAIALLRLPASMTW